MADFQFKSIGSAMQESLEDALLRIEMQKRQQWLDSLTRKSQEADIADRATARSRQSKLDTAAEADRLASIHGPNADLDPAVAAKLRAGGYKVTDRDSIPARSLDMPATSAPGVDGADRAPMVPAFGQPSQAYSRRDETHQEQLAREQREQVTADRDAARQATFVNARISAAERAGENERNRQAATDRANADRDMKLLIADMARSGNAETRALANEFKRLQIAAAQDKVDTAQATREKSASDAQSATQSALQHVNRLFDANDIGGNIGAATGAYELRGFTQGAQDFNAVREQLIAALTLPNLGALKGPMSDKDVAFVKSLATRLGNTRMSESETRRALAEAQTFLRNKLGGGAGVGENTGSASGAIEFVRDANGRIVRRQR